MKRAWQRLPMCWLRGHEWEFQGNPWYTTLCLNCWKEYRLNAPFTVGWKDEQSDPGGGWHHEIAAFTIGEALELWESESAERPWAEWGVFYFGTDDLVRWAGAA
jgi:hypothetical protein